MPTASIHGLEIAYERHGDNGEPLIFVHGYTGDRTDWRHQTPEFSRTHRVLLLDQRGHGASEAPADRAQYTVPQMADDLEALAAHAGFSRYHVVGHSMGGAVAQEIALRSPRRLLSLTLVDSSPRFNIGRVDIVQKFIAARNRIAEEQGMAAVAALPALVKPPPFLPEERQGERKQRLARMSVDGYIGAWQGLEDWAGTLDRIAAIALPTLVVCGEIDAPSLVEASKTLAGVIPDAELEFLVDCGHSPHEERPELFNPILRRHLERNRGD